jgi:DNA-binding MarR family transcriptional regulator
LVSIGRSLDPMPGTDRPGDLPGKIVAALDRLARARRAGRQALATGRGLTPLQIDLLSVLAGGPPPAALVGLLAREVGVSQPTVTDSLRALENKGLVRRDADPRDSRRTMVALTTTGHQLAADLADTDDALAEVIGRLPQDVQEATLESLLTLIARLVDNGTITVARTCITCRFHRHDGTTHHCNLLGIDLPTRELRVNCPEHQPA